MVGNGTALLLSTSGSRFKVDVQQLFEASRQPVAFNFESCMNIIAPDFMENDTMKIEELDCLSKALGELWNAHFFQQDLGDHCAEILDQENVAKEDFDEIGVPLSSAVQVPAADCIHYEKLVAAGLASRVGDHSPGTPLLNYCITKHALDVGEYTVRASHGKPVADMKLHTDPMKMTVVQLAKSLLDNGWKPHDAPVKGKVAPATPHSIEKSKVFYLLRKSSKKILHQKYMQCLLLLSNGKLKKEVCHLQPFKYYNGLINELNGKKQKLPKGLSKARLVKANKKGGGAIPDAAALAFEAAPKPSKKRKDLVRGTRHPLSYMWGKFNFILKVGKKLIEKAGVVSSGAWECTCPIHKHPTLRKTKCKRTMTFHSEEESILVQRRLKHWAIQGLHDETIATRLDHKAIKFKDDEIDDRDIIEPPDYSDLSEC